MTATPAQQAKQAPAEGGADPWQLLSDIDTWACMLPTFEVVHEGGPAAAAENVILAIKKAAAALDMQPKGTGDTPRSDELERLRMELGQERTPAYGDALRLCRDLEIKLSAAQSRAPAPEPRPTGQQVVDALREAMEKAGVPHNFRADLIGYFCNGWNQIVQAPAVGDAEALRLADAIDPFTRKAAPDHLTSKVAADALRRLAAQASAVEAANAAAPDPTWKAAAFDWLMENCLTEDKDGWLHVYFLTGRQREAHLPDCAKWVAGDIAAQAGVWNEAAEALEPREPSEATMPTPAYARHLAAGKRRLRPGEPVPPDGPQTAWCKHCGGCYEWGGNGLHHHAGCPTRGGDVWLEAPASQPPVQPMGGE